MTRNDVKIEAAAFSIAKKTLIELCCGYGFSYQKLISLCEEEASSCFLSDCLSRSEAGLSIVNGDTLADLSDILKEKSSEMCKNFFLVNDEANAELLKLFTLLVRNEKIMKTIGRVNEMDWELPQRVGLDLSELSWDSWEEWAVLVETRFLTTECSMGKSRSKKKI